MLETQKPNEPSSAGRTVPVTFPWESDDLAEITANLAIGSLRDSMLMWLTSERGVHAETLMISIGAVARFAAQHAAWTAVKKPGAVVPQGALMVAEAGGEKYYFGDLINGHLVAQGPSGALALWSLLAGTAVHEGLPSSELPDVIEVFRHVSTTIGKPEFGVPRMPAGHPTHLTPRAALEKFWPHVKFILSRTDGPGPAAGNSVEPEHWPIVIALVARQFVTMAKDTLGLRQSVQLIMEAAVPMSKVDPTKVPQERPPVRS